MDFRKMSSGIFSNTSGWKSWSIVWTHISVVFVWGRVHCVFPWRQVVLPQHSVWQDVAVPPQIRVWGILFCCYLLSVDRCTFACVSGSAVLCQFCLPWTLLQEAFPLKHFWRWTIVSLWCTIWSIATCGTLGLDFFHVVFKSFISRRPSLCITKQGVRAFTLNF